jgi:hypothetical protein
MTLLTLYALCALAGLFIALWRSPRMPRYNLLLVIAAVPQLGNLLHIHVPGMFLVSVATTVVWCLCNRAIPGVLVVAAGALMNLLAMALHGGAMPIRADVLAAVGQLAEPGTRLMGSKDVVVAASPLWLLSDWLVVMSEPYALVVSPGDIVVVAGILCWLVLSPLEERQPEMLTLRAAPAPAEPYARLIPGQSARPALTRLALLAAANPAFAERLLHDPLDAAAAHPHYRVQLDAHDRATLSAIRGRARTVGEFLGELADVVDGK